MFKSNSNMFPDLQWHCDEKKGKSAVIVIWAYPLTGISYELLVPTIILHFNRSFHDEPHEQQKS